MQLNFDGGMVGQKTDAELEAAMDLVGFATTIHSELVQQENIDLNLKRLNDDDLEVIIIIKVLQDKNAAVKVLKLSGNYITLADGKFTAALANNNTLGVLRLQNNVIGREGAKCLAAALANNKTIEVLSIGGNNIGVDGTRYLADALKVNASLKKIYLGGNNIGDEGAKYLLPALMANSTLQQIDLGSNNISDKGAKSIATALLLNQGIRTISLHNNKIGDQGAKKLAEAPEYNRTINELLLWGNPIIKSVLMKINSIVKDVNREQKELTSQQWREIIAMKDEEIADNVKAMVKQDRIITKIDEETASVNAVVRSIDMTSDEGEPENKRPCTDPKSTLARSMHENQKLAQVKLLREVVIEDMGKEELLKKIEEMQRDHNLMVAALNRKNVHIVDLNAVGLDEDGDSNKRARTEDDEAVSTIRDIKVKQEANNSDDDNDDDDEVTYVKTNENDRRTTRSLVRNNGPKVKVEDIVKGRIRCPECKDIVLLPDNGRCNVVHCDNHKPNWIYFCVHCKKVCPDNYSNCTKFKCPKSISLEARIEAQPMRNQYSRENPEVLE